MKKRLAFMSLSCVLVTIAPAMAEPFIDDRTGSSDEYFQQSFANHNASLDNMGSQMRRDHDYSQLSESHRHLTNMQSIQTDTFKTSQDAFNNTQMSAVLGGGIRNSNPSAQSYMMGSLMYGNGSGSSSSQVQPDSWGTYGSSGGGSSGGSYGGKNYGSSSVGGY